MLDPSQAKTKCGWFEKREILLFLRRWHFKTSLLVDGLLFFFFQTRVKTVSKTVTRNVRRCPGLGRLLFCYLSTVIFVNMCTGRWVAEIKKTAAVSTTVRTILHKKKAILRKFPV